MFGLSPFIFLIGAFVAFAIGALVYSLIPVKSDVARRLERAEAVSYDGGIKTRSEAFARIFSEKQRGAIRLRLDEAGWYETTPSRIAMQMIAFGIFGAASSIAFVAIMGLGTTGSAGIVLFTLLAGCMPLSRLTRAVKKRKSEIQRMLPDFLDMLASTVAAGLAFNSALTYAQEVAVGPLGEEIAATLSEVRLGRSRADALRSMAGRVRQDHGRRASRTAGFESRSRPARTRRGRAQRAHDARGRTGQHDADQDGVADGALHAAGAVPNDFRRRGRAVLGRQQMSGRT